MKNKKISFLLCFLLTSLIGFGQDLLDKTLIWNTSTWGNGFGHKIYSYDPGGRVDLRIAGRQNSATWTDIMTITSTKMIGINTNSPQAPLHIVAPTDLEFNSILLGENPKAMGTDAMSYSPNLFLIHTKLDAYLGLHAYVYRKTASTSWTGGTVRLSSSADGSGYSQDNQYNNLNWIDFIGNGFGIDLGCSANEPAISIRGKQVGIGTLNPSGQLDVWRAASNGIITRFGTLFDNGQGIDLKVTQTSVGQGYFSLDNSASSTGWQKLVIPTGNVLIGKTTQTTTGVRYKLDVAGPIRADEIVVNTTGADFVFEPTYKLRSLCEVETFIKQHKHLPDISPAIDMQTNGASLGEMQTKLLQKLEESTLYLIEQAKQIEALKKENQEIRVEKDKQLAEQQKVNAMQEKINKELQQMLLEMKKVIELLKKK